MGMKIFSKFFTQIELIYSSNLLNLLWHIKNIYYMMQKLNSGFAIYKRVTVCLLSGVQLWPNEL